MEDDRGPAAAGRRGVRGVAGSVAAVAVLTAAVIASLATGVAGEAVSRRFASIETPATQSPTQSPSPAASQTPAASAAPSLGPVSAASKGSAGALSYVPFWYATRISHVAIDLPKSAAFGFNVGVEVYSHNSAKVGPVSNVVLTVDVSEIISKVDVAGITGPCARGGATIRCTFGTLMTGKHPVRLTLRARPGAPEGSAGTVRLRVTGNQPSRMSQQVTGIVRISRYETMSDMHWSSTVSKTTGAVGDIITITKTARNDGPHTQSYVEYLGAPKGMTFESAQGCTVTDRGCRIDSIGVGATAVAYLRYRIVDCSGHGYNIGVSFEYGTNDPVNYDVIRRRDYVLKMNGC